MAAAGTEDPQARQRDVASERIRDEIDRVPKLEQGADAVVSLNGVPRGSKNGSGAIIRMRMLWTGNCSIRVKLTSPPTQYR